jgi:4-amino-4-deoxy-L-arabinose transferase-like glycosyltransferase/O-antigen ligase
LALAGLLVNRTKAMYVVLAVSVLLHKELFSIYAWNILPARIVMVAVLVFVVGDVSKSFRSKDTTWVRQGVANPAVLALIAFWAIAGLSLLFSKNIQASLSVFAFLTCIVALALYVTRVMQGDRARVLKFTKFYILLAFILSIVSFVQLVVFDKYKFIFGAFWNVPGHIPRVGSLFWDVNHFAGFLALLLPVVCALVLVSRWRDRVLFFGVGVCLAATLLLTNARSGWIACGVAMLTFGLVLVFRRFSSKGLVVIFSVLVVASLGLLSQYLRKDSPIRREIRQYFHYRLDSFDSHFLLLTGSWQIFEKYPVLGGGYGSFYEQFSKTSISATFFSRDPAALNTRVPAHSIWGELLAETGVLGFSAMLLFYATVVFTLVYAALHLAKRYDFVVCAAMAGGVVGILVAGVFYSYNSEFFWLCLFLYFFYALYALRAEFKDSPARLWSAIYAYFVSSPKFPVVVLSVLALALLLVDLGRNHLIPFDEAIYAKVSQNIVDRHDWLTLSWRNNEPWFEKPPLYFWLSAAMLKIVPSPELAVRLPSALFGVCSVVLVFYFARRLFGKTAGFIAGLALVTTFQFVYYARLGMLDVTCAFFITAALYFYYLGAHPTRGVRPVFLLMLSGAGVGLAILTKGVVGLVPLVILGTAELFTVGAGRHRLGKSLVAALGRIGTVLLIAMLIFVPWHVSMYQLHGQNFITSYLGYHVLERATLDVENKVAPLYWYIVVLKVSMRLWFLALVPALVFALYRLVRRRGDRTALAFVLVWALIVMLVFSLAKAKLVWYIMPLYAALVSIIGYFYSAVLSYLDVRLAKVRYISSFGFKSVAIYLTVCCALVYLLLNKGLVYTSDLTGSQATLLRLKDTIYGRSVKVYADRIDLPLLLFYTAGPFELTDFTPLREAVKDAAAGEHRLVFITKESRFKKLQAEFPVIKLVSSDREWYLGEVTAK